MCRRVTGHACRPCVRQALLPSIDVNVSCTSEEAARYTKKENRRFLIADAAQDPKVVHLRCPSPAGMLRLHSYECGVAHYETFMNDHPLLATLVEEAAFGSTESPVLYYDIQMPGEGSPWI